MRFAVFRMIATTSHILLILPFSIPHFPRISPSGSGGRGRVQASGPATSSELLKSRAMLLIAHACARKALGPTHVVNAYYEGKLAVLQLQEGQPREALALVSSALATFEW